MKKRSDLKMSLFIDHVVDRSSGSARNFPKMPTGVLPFRALRYGIVDGEDLLDYEAVNVPTLGDALKTTLSSMTATGGDITMFRVIVNLDTDSLPRAQTLRDEIHSELKAYVVKRRVPGSRGWRVGAVRRGKLSENYSALTGVSTYSYYTDILVSNRIWYNNDHVTHVDPLDDAEFEQLQKAVFIARDKVNLVGTIPVRTKVSKLVNVKTGKVENRKLIGAFA